MSVWHEVGMDSGQREIFAQDIGVPLRRMRYPGCLSCELSAYKRAGLSPIVGTQQALPRQTNRRDSVELLIEPIARGFVLRE